MARILMAWEFGLGLGHIMPLLKTAEPLVELGHEVVITVTETQRYKHLFVNPGIQLVQSPRFLTSPSKPVAKTLCYAHLLHNLGWDNSENLKKQVSAWRHISKEVNPDLVLVEHAPTALLALKDSGPPILSIGSGFTSPPPVSPLGVFRRQNLNGDQLKDIRNFEKSVVDTINDSLAGTSVGKVSKLLEIYSAIRHFFIHNFAEFDHFGKREDITYMGAWPADQMNAVKWPKDSTGKKVFCYLRPSPGISPLIQWLSESGYEVIAVLRHLAPEVSASLKTKNVTVFDMPVGLNALLPECDITITNGNAATLAQSILNNAVTIALPLQMEQLILSENLYRQKLATVAFHNDLNAITRAVSEQSEDKQYKKNRRKLINRYKTFDWLDARKKSVDILLNYL